MITYACTELMELADSSIAAEDSIILRYHRIFSPAIDFSLLKKVSIREGCRILGPIKYHGTNIFVLDMASLMADGNFKSSVACMSMARIMEQGARGLVVCSSGNTGTAIARYSKASNLETYIFIPKISSYKIDFSVIDETIHQVEIIDKPEWEVHAIARTFAKENSFAFVPSIEHQLEANSCRALFMLEYMRESGVAFHWTSQAVSGGHGPAGFYKKLYSLSEKGMQIDVIPGFIGVQQSGISPMYNAWNKGRNHIDDEDINLYPSNIIEPTLYSTRPDQNYRYLHDIMMENGGTLYCIDISEYKRLEAEALRITDNCGLNLKTVKKGDSKVISEKAGILSIMGVLKAIEDGLISSEENVLATFTGTTFV